MPKRKLDSPLSKIMYELDITNSILAQALGTSMSVVTKWKSGDLPSQAHNRLLIILLGRDIRNETISWRSKQSEILSKRIKK